VERDVLGAIPYRRNDAVLHTDEALLPRRPKTWSAWNYHVRADGGPVAVTYDLNLLQHLPARRTWCVTLNEEEQVRPEAVFERMTFEHPSYASGRDGARARRSELLAANRTSYCGAYWGAGFHEDGVASAHAVVAALEAAA
jgi:predicted NAD/FAD-binding protein